MIGDAPRSGGSNRLAFGVIGCSRVARKYFLPAALRASTAGLHAIGSRHADKARVWAREFGDVRSGSYEDVLASDVDAVYISTPVGLHEEWAVRAAQAGKHVLCEKSLTPTYAATKRVLQACAASGVRLMEAFAFRFHPQHALVLQWINEGRIGAIAEVYAAFGFPPRRQAVFAGT